MNIEVKRRLFPEEAITYLGLRNEYDSYISRSQNLINLIKQQHKNLNEFSIEQIEYNVLIARSNLPCDGGKAIFNQCDDQLNDDMSGIHYNCDTAVAYCLAISL